MTFRHRYIRGVCSYQWSESYLLFTHTKPNFSLTKTCQQHVQRVNSRSSANLATDAKMRFIQFTYNNHKSIGLRIGKNVVDLIAHSPELPRDLKTALESCRDTLLREAKRAVDSGGFRLPLEDIQLMSPITGPDKVLCVGNNYYDHCAEQGIQPPSEPVLFSKFSSSITATGTDIPYPAVTKQLDYEVELAIVIAKTCKEVQEDEAIKYVFGYTIGNDLSARDLQFSGNAGQWILGKSLDRFCPLGPEIVTKEALNDPHNLTMKTEVNGVVKQDSNTSQMVFKTAAIVAYASKFFTLLPGDVILTGTPPGVGVFRKPPEFLKSGDVVTVSIDDLGSITNTIK